MNCNTNCCKPEEEGFQPPQQRVLPAIYHENKQSRGSNLSSITQEVVHERLFSKGHQVTHQVPNYQANRVYQNKTIEVPQYEQQHINLEYPFYDIKNKIVEIPRVETKERVNYITKNVERDVPFEENRTEYVEVTQEHLEEVPIVVPHIINKEEKVQQEVERQYEVERVVEVPHVMHTFRNVMTPQYRQIPKPVEVPMTHYKPIPVERIVDRNVPVPVEVNIIQEFICPKIEPVYYEVPIPIHVKRIIEHPVPREAILDNQLLPLYYQVNQSSPAGPGITGYCCPEKNGSNEVCYNGMRPVQVIAQPVQMNESAGYYFQNSNTGTPTERSATNIEGVNRTSEGLVNINYSGRTTPIQMVSASSTNIPVVL